MKKHLLIIVSALLSFNTFAQKKDLSVGTDLVFDGYSSSILFRKYSNDMQTAKRYRLNNLYVNNELQNGLINEEITNLTAIDNKLKFYNYTTYSLGFAIGKQKNIYKIDKFQFYMGNNNTFGAIFERRKSSNITYSPDGDKKYKATKATLNIEKKYYINLSRGKFIGAQYNIAKNLFFTVELFANLNLNTTIRRYNYYHYTITDKTEENKDESNKIKPNLNTYIGFGYGANAMLTYQFDKLYKK